MPDALEVSLARVLRRAAEAAPEPADDAADVLLRERARRAEEEPRHGGRLLAAAAAVTVLLLVAAVAAVALLRGDQNVKPISPPTRIVHTDYQDGAAITDVWPDAVRTVPATMTIDNQPYGFNIERVLPDGELVVVPVGDDPDISHLWVLDPKTGNARAVSPSGHWVVVVAQQADPGDARWIAWISLADGSAGDAPAYLWYAPAAGGKPRKALSAPISTSAGTDQSALRLLISGNTLVISPALAPARDRPVPPIRTVTLGENRVETVKDSANLTVLQWPWLSDTRTPGHRTIRNAETGEQRQARLPARWSGVRCSISWCVGQDGKRLMAARRDGSGVRLLGTGTAGYGIAQDRFLIVAGRTAYDLVAKKTLTLPRPAGEKSTVWETIGFIGEGGATPLFTWTKSDSTGLLESYLLIDVQAMV